MVKIIIRDSFKAYNNTLSLGDYANSFGPSTFANLATELHIAYQCWQLYLVTITITNTRNFSTRHKNTGHRAVYKFKMHLEQPERLTVVLWAVAHVCVCVLNIIGRTMKNGCFFCARKSMADAHQKFTLECLRGGNAGGFPLLLLLSNRLYRFSYFRIKSWLCGDVISSLGISTDPRGPLSR